MKVNAPETQNGTNWAGALTAAGEKFLLGLCNYFLGFLSWSSSTLTAQQPNSPSVINYYYNVFIHAVNIIHEALKSSLLVNHKVWIPKKSHQFQVHIMEKKAIHQCFIEKHVYIALFIQITPTSIFILTNVIARKDVEKLYCLHSVINWNIMSALTHSISSHVMFSFYGASLLRLLILQGLHL